MVPPGREDGRHTRRHVALTPPLRSGLGLAAQPIWLIPVGGIRAAVSVMLGNGSQLGAGVQEGQNRLVACELIGAGMSSQSITRHAQKTSFFLIRTLRTGLESNAEWSKGGSLGRGIPDRANTEVAPDLRVQSLVRIRFPLSRADESGVAAREFPTALYVIGERRT